MKKVLFGFLCLSFVSVMSCGGSSTTGTAADANSSVAGAAVSSCLAGYNPAGVLETVSVGINQDVSWPVTETVECSIIEGGVSGSIALDGTINISVSDDASFTMAGTINETMTDCTVTDTACDFGEVVGNGALVVTIDGSGSGSTFTFTETVTGDLSFVFQGQTLACPVDLTLTVNADTSYTQDGLVDAMTGTVCGADWASVKAALADSTEMEALCAAFDAQASNI